MDFKVGDKVTFNGAELWDMAHDDTSTNNYYGKDFDNSENETFEYTGSLEYTTIDAFLAGSYPDDYSEPVDSYSIHCVRTGRTIENTDICVIEDITKDKVTIKSENAYYADEIAILSKKEADASLRKVRNLGECETSGNFAGATPDHMLGSPVRLGYPMVGDIDMSTILFESSNSWTMDRYENAVLNKWLDFMLSDNKYASLSGDLADDDIQNLLDAGLDKFVDYVFEEFPMCKDTPNCDYDVAWCWDNFKTSSRSAEKIGDIIDQYIQNNFNAENATDGEIDWTVVSDGYDPDETAEWLRTFKLTSKETNYILDSFEDGEATDNNEPISYYYASVGFTHEEANEHAKERGDPVENPMYIDVYLGHTDLDVSILFDKKSLEEFLGHEVVAIKRRKPTYANRDNGYKY